MAEKLYGTKEEISQLFGVPVKTLSNDLTEMRKSGYGKHILRPTHKRVYIEIRGYESFLKFKHQMRAKKF